jgi:hypothetical protein
MYSAYVPYHAPPHRSAARYIIRVSGYSSDWNTFDACERPEPYTPTLAQQFQHVIWHAIVCLSNTGDCGLNPCFCSRQAKSEEVFHLEILDHPHFLDGAMEGKGHTSYDLADIPRESQRPEADVLFMKAKNANLTE